MSSPRYRKALALLAASLLCGCKIYSGQKKGESNTFGFYEPNDYPGDTASSAAGFERPLALGARADAWVLASGISSLSSATVDDPEIVSVSLSVYPIVLRARAEGSTTLRVRGSTASDSLPLTVVRPDDARVWIPSTSTFLDLPDSFFGKGYALRPGASLLVSATPLAGGKSLLGFELFEWSIDPPLLSLNSGGSTVNTQRLTALGSSGVARVTTQLGGELEVATLSPADAPTLRLYSVSASLSQPTEIAALAPPDIGSFLLAGNDAAGRFVKPGPADDAALQVSVTAGSVTILEAKRSGDYVSLRACAGTGTVRISYEGGERSVPIEVSPEVADPACP